MPKESLPQVPLQYFSKTTSLISICDSVRQCNLAGRLSINNLLIIFGLPGRGELFPALRGGLQGSESRVCVCLQGPPSTPMWCWHFTSGSQPAPAGVFGPRDFHDFLARARNQGGHRAR